MKYLVLFIFIILITSCNRKSKHKSQTTPMETIEKLVKKQYGDQVKTMYNESKTFVVAKHKKKMSNNTNFPTIEFTIYKIDNLSALFSDIVPGGALKWISDSVLEVRSLVGRPRAGTQKKKVLYQYDVRKASKIKF